VQSIVGQKLAQTTYAASLANLSYGVSLTPSGLCYSFSGYSDRLPSFAKFVVSSVGGMEVDRRVFEVVKDRKLRALQGVEKEPPQNQAFYYAGILLDRALEVEECLEVVRSSTLEDVRGHLEGVLGGRGDVEAVCMGNVGEEEAKAWFEDTMGILEENWANFELKSKSKSKSKSKWVPSSSILAFNSSTSPSDVSIHMQSTNPTDENGAVVAKMQSNLLSYTGPADGPDCLRRAAAIRVLNHMLREPLFDELRTKQTLGYIVTSALDVGYSGCNSMDQDTGIGNVEGKENYHCNKIDSIYIVIVSKKVSPVDITNRLFRFLAQFESTLASSGEDVLSSHKIALRKKIDEPHKNLSSEVGEVWPLIRRFAPCAAASSSAPGGVNFDAMKDVSKAIGDVTKEDVLEAYREVVAGPNARRVVSCVYGNRFTLEKSRGEKCMLGGRRLETVQEIRRFAAGLPVVSKDNANGSYAPRGGFFLRRNIVGVVGVGIVVGVGVAVGLIFRNKKTPTTTHETLSSIRRS